MASKLSIPPKSVPGGGIAQLTDEEIGHLRHIHRLAYNLPGEWALMGTLEPDGEGDDALRYQLAFMSYALAVAHYHKTPAWPEFYRDVLARLIAKMLRRDVFGYWRETSKGAPMYDPDFEGYGEGWFDPVAKANVMYSGHVLQMLGLYEVLFGDHRFDSPGSIRFAYETVFRGYNESFEYDHESLARCLYDQFVASGYEGVCCELNAIFAPCNQHLILGLMHFDHAHGTNLSEDVRSKWLEVWDREGYVDPETKSIMRHRFARQGQTVHEAPVPWADGWTGTFMHAWAPGTIEELYPFHVRRHVRWLDDRSATVERKSDNRTAAADFGHMATYAAELGDLRTRDALLEYARRYLSPVWLDGGLYYERNDDRQIDDEGVSRYVTRLTGNGLLPLARINVPNGLQALYQSPWSSEHHGRPKVASVPYPEVMVTRAHVEEDGVLSARLTRWLGRSSGRYEFAVEQLGMAEAWTVSVDGSTVGRLDGNAFEPAGEGFDGVTVTSHDGRLVVSVGHPPTIDIEVAPAP